MQNKWDTALRLLLGACITACVAGLVMQFCGSDLGLALVLSSMAIGVFPAFHFASLVAKAPTNDDKTADLTGREPDQSDRDGEDQ